MLEGIKRRDANDTCKWFEADLNRAAETLAMWRDREKNGMNLFGSQSIEVKVENVFTAF